MSTHNTQSPAGRRNTAEVLEVEVAAIRREAEAVVSLEIRATSCAQLPQWQPGAHLTIRMSPGLERQYSLCGDRDVTDAWRVAVLREPDSRGGSIYMHEQLAVGDRLVIVGPTNNFPLTEAEEYLFVAGGIGVTPLLPMAQELERRGASWRLLYGGRSIASMAFLEELAQYGSRVQVRPQDECGLLDLIEFVGPPREGVAIYCCGPEPLLAAMENLCSEWPTGALNVERFRATPQTLEAGGEGFEVELEERGTVLTVAPGQSILETLEAAGIEVPTSCREGTCGTCETSVIEGIPEHRDSFLTEDEKADNASMMICVSRSKSPRLVLEL